jgi:NAD(P)-dependent dehydrogenase (short-subunit alcohol dehydrogenase family)
MKQEVLGQRMLVIGGSSGIGLATARLAAEAGADVTIATRDRRKLDAAQAQLGQGAEAAVLDTSDEAGLE